jgi:phosphate acyltransferase
LLHIGLDMMGGDFAPKETCEGLIQFLQSAESADCMVTAIGDEQSIRNCIPNLDESKVQIIHTTEIVEMQDHPVKVLRDKPNSSMSVGFQLLKQNKLDAFISAGNTGVMLVGAVHIIEPISGVARPTIPTIVPRLDGGTSLLLDVGINADCKPENLDQFAILGSNYAEHVLKIKNPKIGLLNIGEEEGKGNLLAKAAYPILKANTDIQFIGNLEGRDLFEGKADVIVCDGFVGNIVLKLAESIYDIFHEKRGVQDTYLDRFNHKAYGGTPVLGVNKTVIVAHGISKAPSFCNMLAQAKDMVNSNLVEILKTKFVATVG